MAPLPGGEPDGEEEKNMNKEQATALANEGKKKATAFWTMFKEKVVALWKSGRKGKAICIGGAAVIVLLLTRCGGNEGSGDSSDGDDWKWTGQSFYTVFKGFPEDEGVVYKNDSCIVKVLQGTKDGCLAETKTTDRVVWVVTQKRYEDGQCLEDGFYIRRGSVDYETTLGTERTVARYVEVTDEAIVREIQKQIEDGKAAEAQAKLEAEGQPFEVDAPVKSLCGFAIGTTPHNVKSFFSNPNEGKNMMSGVYTVSGKLATPFRYFDYATLRFETGEEGIHLNRVLLRSEQSPLKSAKECREEVATIVAMLEKKFGIQFKTKHTLSMAILHSTCGNLQAEMRPSSKRLRYQCPRMRKILCWTSNQGSSRPKNKKHGGENSPPPNCRPTPAPTSCRRNRETGAVHQPLPRLYRFRNLPPAIPFSSRRAELSARHL